MLISVAWRGQSQVEANLFGAAAVGAEVITIATKFFLARVTARRGHECQSSLLIAVSRDNRSDIFTSVLVLLAILGSIGDLPWVEPAAAVLIGALIVGVFRNGLTLAGLDVYYQTLAVGILIILAVSVDQWIRRARA